MSGGSRGRAPDGRTDTATGHVVAAVSDDRDDDILEAAAQESTLRGVPLIIIARDSASGWSTMSSATTPGERRGPP